MATLTPSQAAQYVYSKAPSLGLDPNAVLAVAQTEGLGGGVGDNGTSFGPWQLHIGGALPAEIGAQGPSVAQAWAWSQAGIDYALQQMSNVARGLKGQSAVSAIVTNFERPANPSAEIKQAVNNLETWILSQPSGQLPIDLAPTEPSQTGAGGGGSGTQVATTTSDDPCAGAGTITIPGVQAGPVNIPDRQIQIPGAVALCHITTWLATSANWWKLGLTGLGAAMVVAGVVIYIKPHIQEIPA